MSSTDYFLTSGISWRKCEGVIHSLHRVPVPPWYPVGGGGVQWLANCITNGDRGRQYTDGQHTDDYWSAHG